MIGRSHPLSPAKGVLLGIGISLVLWVVAVVVVVGMARDHAARGELPVLSGEVTR